MDLNIVKVENDNLINTDIYIKTEPVDNSSELLTEACPFIKVDHQDEVNAIKAEANIKSEDLNIKDESVLQSVDVDDHYLANMSYFSTSEDVYSEEKEHLLEIAEEKLHASRQFGESSRQNQYSRKSAHVCEECGKLCKYKSVLIYHMRCHSGERPFKCDMCEKSFNLRSHLNSHISVHSGEKPHKCEVCNKTFNKKSNLTVHKIIHTGDKPYCCDQCDQQFTQKNVLVKHKRIHSGEKPYECDVCGKAFAIKSSLDRHRLIHTGEKPFSCNSCPKSFRDASALAKHKRRIHKN